LFSSLVEFGQFGLHEVDEGLEGGGVEGEAAAGGGEEFGEGTGAAEGEGLVVVAEGLGVVVLGVGPDLEGAKLGDGVFDVVEGVEEDVELPVPGVGAGGFVAGPVDVAAEAVDEGDPGVGALGTGVGGVGVEPVLKGIDGGDPGEEGEDGLEVVLAGAAGFVGGVEGVEVFVAEEFHGHGGDFAEFNGGVAVVVEGFFAGGEGVEGVAGFVEHGFDVVLLADGVHEDEGEAGFGKGGLVAAGGFAFAVVEVEEVEVAQGLEAAGEGAVEVVEDVLGAVDHLVHVEEGAEGGAAEGIDGEVPGAEGGELELGAAVGVEGAEGGDDVEFDGVVELEAIVGGVVEAAAGAEGVGEVVGEAGVGGDGGAEVEELVEGGFDGFDFLEAALGDELPGFLAEGAVGFFEVAAHLGEGGFLAAEVDGEGAGEFLVLLAEAGFVGFEGDVFGAEEFDVELGVAVEDVVAGLGELGAEGVGEVDFREFELAGFELRLDLLDELEVGALGLGAVGVTGHGDVAAGGFFVEGGGEFAPVEEPVFEAGEGDGGVGVEFEGVEVGLDLGPVAEVEVGGEELARGVRG